MGEVGFFYRSSVALGCLILMLASIACTGWFFYSWLGGVPGIVGAGVGCAVQLMAYGFSGVIVHQKGGALKFVLTSLIASALALSVLSSYATLNGYFSALQAQSEAKAAQAAKKERAIQAALEQRMQLMESMSRDVKIGSQAADQGLGDKYRTQANQFLQNNAATRDEMVAQIEQVEALAQSDLLTETEAKEASPIDGLSGVLGSQSSVIVILCIWLALMFDALPIVGITLFESRAKKKKEEKAQAAMQAQAVMQSQTESVQNALVVTEAVPEGDHAQVAAALLDDRSEPVLVELNSEPAEPEPEKQFRVFMNICSQDLAASKAFFTQLLDLEVKYDSDWYVQLCSADDPEMEFGVIQYDHELVPTSYRGRPSGMYMTFVVPDVNASYQKALELGLQIIQAPRNEFYGQRRFLVLEPSGCLIDICSPWEDEPETEPEPEAEMESSETDTQPNEKGFEEALS